MRCCRGFLTLVALTVLAAGCAQPVARRVLSPRREGWVRVGELQRFTPENLFELIDGEAEFVIPFGFRELTRATYRRSSDAEATVDIYDMGSPGGAFGLFRSRSSVEAQPAEVGTEGAADESRVEFWQDRFYVAASVPSAQEQPRVLALARSVARGLPPTRAWPAYLDLLPTNHRIPRSEQYTPNSFLGQEVFRNAVFAEYKVPHHKVKLFVCACDGVGDASAALAVFRSHLAKRQPAEPLALGDGGFVAAEPFLGRIACFRRGRYVAGMLGHAEAPALDALLAALDRQLTSR